MNFPRLVLLVHRWAGLGSCAFLVAIALSGTVLVYGPQLNRAFVPALHRIEPGGAKQALSATLDTVRAQHPHDPPIILRRGAADTPDEVVLKSWLAVTVNPYTGAIVGAHRPNRSVAGVIGAIHSRLLAGKAGHVIVGIAGLIALLEAATGLIRWWRTKTFWIARGATFRRVIFELHNTSGFFAVLLVVPLSLTGTMLSFGAILEPAFRHFDHQPAMPPAAADAPRAESADDAVRIALATRPGDLVSVGIPQKERDPWIVSIRGSGDHMPWGGTRVSVKQDGRVTWIGDGGAGQRGIRMMYWRDGIHGGWILGGVGELLVAIGGVALAFQAVTGFLVWWKPR